MQVLLSFLLRERSGRSGPKYVVLELNFHHCNTITQTSVSDVIVWLLLLPMKSKYLRSAAPGVGKIIAKYLCLTFYGVSCLSVLKCCSVFWYLLRNYEIKNYGMCVGK